MGWLQLALYRFVWNLHREAVYGTDRPKAIYTSKMPAEASMVYEQSLDWDVLCHQCFSPQRLDSTSIFQCSEPCSRIKAKHFGWTSSSLDPTARPNRTPPRHLLAYFKFHEMTRGLCKPPPPAHFERPPSTVALAAASHAVFFLVARVFERPPQTNHMARKIKALRL
jgi:hypothetical protein